SMVLVKLLMTDAAPAEPLTEKAPSPATDSAAARPQTSIPAVESAVTSSVEADVTSASLMVARVVPPTSFSASATATAMLIAPDEPTAADNAADKSTAS